MTNNGHHLHMEGRGDSHIPQAEDNLLAVCLPELSGPLYGICVELYRTQE